MADSHEEIRLETDQLGGEVGKAIELALRQWDATVTLWPST